MGFEVAARVVAGLLSEHRGLPAPRKITLNRANFIGTPEIRFQITELEHLAQWAKALRVPVHVTDMSSYVRVNATQVVNGCVNLEVWGAVRHGDAWKLVTAHGKSLDEPAGVDLSADKVLADLANTTPH
jgi:hypothetical protein